MKIITGMFKGPKVPALPPKPDESIAESAADRERKALVANQVDTINTSGQGISGKRKLLGGS